MFVANAVIKKLTKNKVKTLEYFLLSCESDIKLKTFGLAKISKTIESNTKYSPSLYPKSVKPIKERPKRLVKNKK